MALTDEQQAAIQQVARAWGAERRRMVEARRQEALRLARAFYAAGAVEVILFGSTIQGTVGRHSDLDMVVVTPGPLPEAPQDRYQDLLASLSPRYPVDLWVYTPEEWLEVKARRAFVQQEIVQKGEVLRAH